MRQTITVTRYTHRRLLHGLGHRWLHETYIARDADTGTHIGTYDSHAWNSQHERQWTATSEWEHQHDQATESTKIATRTYVAP